MAQKGQKSEVMSCGEVHAVCGFHTQGFCSLVNTVNTALVLGNLHCMVLGDDYIHI